MDRRPSRSDTLLNGLCVVVRIATLIVWARLAAWCTEPIQNGREQGAATRTARSVTARPAAVHPRRPP